MPLGVAQFFLEFGARRAVDDLLLHVALGMMFVCRQIGTEMLPSLTISTGFRSCGLVGAARVVFTREWSRLCPASEQQSQNTRKKWWRRGELNPRA